MSDKIGTASAFLLDAEQIATVMEDLKHSLEHGAGSVMIVVGEPVDGDTARRTSDDHDMDGMMANIPTPAHIALGTAWTVAMEQDAETVFLRVTTRPEMN